MSEDRPVYIACASGNQAMTDFLIQRRGDLVEIVGHPIMQMTPQDALEAAQTIKIMVSHILSERASKLAGLEDK